MKERKVSLKRRSYLEAVCALVLQFLLYHSAACTVIGLFYESEHPEYYQMLLFFAIPILYLTLIRKYIKKFLLCLFLHLPVFCSVVFVGEDFGQKTVICVCTVIMAVISLHMCTMEKGSIKECPPMKLCLVLLVCYAFSRYMGHLVCARYIYGEILVFIVLRFIYDSVSNMSDFIRMNQDKTNFPAGQITIVNQMILLVFLGVLITSLLLFPKLHMEIILLPLIEMGGIFFTWLLSFIHLPESDISSSTIQRTDMQSLVRALRKESEYEDMWAVIEAFLQSTVIIFIAACIIAGISYLFYRMYKVYYANQKENADEKEFLIGEIKWFGKRKIHYGKKAKEGQDSFSRKIRKEYHRYVKSNFNKKENVPDALTPKEMLVFLREREQKSIMDDKQQERIREIYERARYSQTECSQTELDELKKLLRSK